MHYITITILALLPPCMGVVDCRAACRRCRERDDEHPGILEVYCAMCQECKDRRRERMGAGRLPREQSIYNRAEYPDNCPTPPPCDTDIDDIPQPLKQKITTPPTTTTSTTTRRPCPPIPPCKKRSTVTPCCIPMVPMCPCPYPYHPPQSSTANRQKLVMTTAKDPAHMYVYVGVPKGVLDKRHR